MTESQNITTEMIKTAVEEAVRNTQPVKLMSLKDVTELTQKTPPTIYSLAKQGLFPKPRRFGKSSTVWLQSEVDNFLKNLPTIE